MASNFLSIMAKRSWFVSFYVGYHNKEVKLGITAKGIIFISRQIGLLGSTTKVSHLVPWQKGHRVPTFSKYQIPGFLKVFGPKFQGFFKSFLCQTPGTFIQILVTKISKCVKTDVGFPLLLWYIIPCIFHVKAMKSKFNLALNQCLCW